MTKFNVSIDHMHVFDIVVEAKDENEAAKRAFTKYKRFTDIERLGTTNRNPVTSSGHNGYIECYYCKKWYTRLGVARHRSKCKQNPKNYTETATTSD